MRNIKVVATSFRGITILEEFLKINSLEIDSVVIATRDMHFELSSAKIKIETGKGERFGLDGGSPQRSERLAEKCREEIFSALDGAEFILGITELGDDDGEGIPVVIADVAKEIGALTIFCAVMPVKNWMVPFRRRYAQEFLDKLIERADYVMRIDDEYFLQTLSPKTLMTDFFRMTELSATQDVKNILDCYVNRNSAFSR